MLKLENHINKSVYGRKLMKLRKVNTSRPWNANKWFRLQV